MTDMPLLPGTVVLQMPNGAAVCRELGAALPAFLNGTACCPERLCD